MTTTETIAARQLVVIRFNMMTPLNDARRHSAAGCRENGIERGIRTCGSAEHEERPQKNERAGPLNADQP
jgi:hypothetical protein